MYMYMNRFPDKGMHGLRTSLRVAKLTDETFDLQMYVPPIQINQELVLVKCFKDILIYFGWGGHYMNNGKKSEF